MSEQPGDVAVEAVWTINGRDLKGLDTLRWYTLDEIEDWIRGRETPERSAMHAAYHRRRR